MVADAVFDPPAGSVIRPDSPPARLAAQGAGRDGDPALAARDPGLHRPERHGNDATRSGGPFGLSDGAQRGVRGGSAPWPSVTPCSPGRRELNLPNNVLPIVPVADPASVRVPPAPLDWTDNALGFQTVTIVDTNNRSIFGSLIIDVLRKS